MLIAILLERDRDRSHWLCEHVTHECDDFQVLRADMLETVQDATLAKLQQIESKSAGNPTTGHYWRTPSQIRERAQREFNDIQWGHWDTEGIAASSNSDIVIKLINFDADQSGDA